MNLTRCIFGFCCLIVQLSTLLKTTAAEVVELRDSNLEDLVTETKASFVMFYDSGCFECEDISKVWNQLAKDWVGHEHGQILQVDCGEEDAQGLCGYFQVHHFPTLAFGGAHEWDFYTGSHDYESLSEFAKETISKPICTVIVKENCDEEDLAKITKLEAMSSEELVAIMEQAHEKMEALHKTFDAEEMELKERQRLLNQEFDAIVNEAAGEYDFKILMQVMQKRQFGADLEEDFDE